MNTAVTIIYNSFLYYCCLVLLTRFIWNCQLKKGVLLGSFLLFIPFVIAALPNQEAMLYPAYLILVSTQLLLLKFSCKGLKLRWLLLGYIMLYFTNMLLAAPIAAIVPEYYFYVDIAVNTFTSLLCALVCLTKLRYAVQQALEWTPKYILLICVFLLISAAAVSTFVSGFQHFIYPEIWNRWLQVIVAFLLLAVCIVLPVIFVISISNARLKSLTADYEQQIHAQAAHYQELAAANYEARRFRHDFKNMSIAIETSLAREEYSQALELIRQCNNTLKGNSSALAFDTGNGIADALLADKQAKAAACGAAIIFTGMIPSASLSPTDLCVILGNTLDNAIEACQKLPVQGDKTISVNGACNGGFLFLTIQNPIGEKVIIQDNRIATTKDNKTLHGFGLYSLNAVTKKYGGEVRLCATDDCFTVNIDLCMV